MGLICTLMRVWSCLIEAWSLREKFSPGRMFLKKSGLWLILGSPWKSNFSGCDPIGPLKTFCRAQWRLKGLGANVRQYAKVTLPPCPGLMRCVKISNDKMGEGHPPPGVVKARSNGAALTPLLTPFSDQKMEFVQVETQRL